MHTFVPEEAATIAPPVRDDSITIIESTDNSDDDDDPFGSNPAAGDGEDDYKDYRNDGGNGAHDNEAGNDGFVNDNSVKYEEDASMEVDRPAQKTLYSKIS